MQSIKISFALAAVCAAGVFAQQAVREKADPMVHRAELALREEPPALHRIERTAPQYSLGRLRPSEARPPKRKPGLTPIGISRALPSDLVNTGEWSTTPEGRMVWRLSLRSENAVALRVHFRNFHTGAGQVWVLTTDEAGSPVSAGPYSGDGPYGDGDFWTDMVSADSLVVAYEPADQTSRAVPFTLAELSHRFAPEASAVRKAADAPKAAAASCTVDTACHPAYSEPASAVALMIFESEGESYQCTGALVGSASQPVLPFFLTANHCISTADEARSLITFFNYQTADCKGTKPSLGRSPRVTGSTFVVGGGIALGDYTLLQLSGFPSVDVKLLGWTSDDIAANQQVTSISHPAGDAKRIALGERTRDATVRFSDGVRMPANRGYQVSWFEGVTQGGSSGSPLLATIDGKTYVVGVLSGGPDIDEDDDAVVCRSNNLIASYGRFTSAFRDLQPYLTSSNGGPREVPVPAAPSISATPLAAANATGITTIAWQAPGYSRVQIRVGSPDGVPMTGLEATSGSVQSGPWATEGMTFYLQNASDGASAGAAKTLATVRLQRPGSPVQKTGSLTLAQVGGAAPGQSSMTVRVTWQAIGVSRVQVRVDSPNGAPLTGIELPEGSGTTGSWVVTGTTFYLQDASDGNSSGASKTLATVRASLGGR